jgi:hypothetical protein
MTNENRDPSPQEAQQNGQSAVFQNNPESFTKREMQAEIERSRRGPPRSRGTNGRAFEAPQGPIPVPAAPELPASSRASRVQVQLELKRPFRCLSRRRETIPVSCA